MTYADTKTLLGLIKGCYGARFEVYDDTIAIWAEFFADLELADVVRAAKEHIASSQHPPTIAEIRAIATRPPGLPSWEQAWFEVLQEIQRVGRYRGPSFSHPAVTQAVDSIGWQAICNSEEGQLATLRAQFRDMYNGYRGRAVQAANVGRLEGHGQPSRLGQVAPGKALAMLQRRGDGEP